MTNNWNSTKTLRLMGMSDRWDAFIETREQHHTYPAKRRTGDATTKPNRDAFNRRFWAAKKKR